MLPGTVHQRFSLQHLAHQPEFECLLRRLDAEQHQLARDMSDLYRQNRVVGFHTYGEQFGSMHVNQTFTGVAIGRRPS